MKATVEIDSFDQETDNKLLRNLYCILTSEQEFLKSLAFSSTLGLIPKIQQIIETKDNLPIICKPYAVPCALREATCAEIVRLEMLGIIWYFKNGWGSPVFLKQKNGEIRLLNDYRLLNKMTIPMALLNPGADKMSIELQGSTVFSKLDLRQGYYQIQMA
ncbi:putative retrovirus polyprotein [Pseudoloma neurophilia]|uniref:Putative retrovirus polyprotein n=1 Tax=Pseudoloma neurophilia TaxID=146866 RepID=A0A0R0M5H1_9MICR|nr:putative retrovirus polyprotein [Pseudoloma neurophilia]